MINEDLDFEPCGNTIVAEGGEGSRAWRDTVDFYKAEVPGGFLVLAARDDTSSGIALTFVPTSLKKRMSK